MSTSNNNRINDDNHVDRSVTTDQPNDGDRGAGSSISDSNSSSGNRPVQPPQKYLQYAEKPTTSSGEFDDNTIELKVTPVMEDDENNDHSCNIMNDNSRNEQHPISESQVDGTIRKLSLNTIYGNRIGIIQSIVLLLNIGLLLYAHIGISAVIVSNQKRIDAYDDQSSNNNNNNNNTTTANGGSCTELPNDMTLWYNQGGQMNRSDHSNYCSRTYVWNVTQNVCLLDRTCISQCFQDRYGYSVNCAACFAAVPACGLQNGCAGMCATDHASVECETCNIPCTQQLETCTGLTTTNATTNSTTNDTNNVRRWLTDSKDDQNEEICRTQQMGVHWDRVVDRTKFHIVYTLRFMYAIRDAWNGNAKVLAILVVLFSGIWPYVKILLLYATWYYPFTKTSTQRYGILVSLKRLGKYTFVDVYAVIVIMIGILMKANIADVPVIVTAEPRPAIIAFLFAAIWNAIHFEWMMQLHHNANHLMNQNYCSNSNSNNTNNRNTESVDIVGKYNYNHNDVTSRECDSNDNNNKDDDDNNKMNSHSMTHMDEMHKKQEEDVSDVVYNGVNVSNIDEEKDTTNGAEHVNVLVSNGRKSTRNDAIVMHLRFQDSDDSKSYLECKSQLCLQVFVIMLLLTVVTTYIAGCILELVRFTTFVGDDTVGCIKSYNLYTIATELVSDFFSYGNSAKFGAWILCISYILFIGVCPIFVHLVHIMVFAFQMKCTKSICRAADMSWSFASVEIMLLALIIVQHKFDDLVASFAGNQNAEFFGLTAELGPGFYILIVYSICAGFLHYIFFSAVSEYHHMDTHHKICFWWTKLFKCMLRDTRKAT